mmetsp:Transcript_31015/g.27433  ORF Transcript_31015/g.27433 Transcript_31015/m.27433 type:complete len:211 (+) Transcript_31015:381-1013(+)
MKRERKLLNYIQKKPIHRTALSLSKFNQTSFKFSPNKHGKYHEYFKPGTSISKGFRRGKTVAKIESYHKYPSKIICEPLLTNIDFNEKYTLPEVRRIIPSTKTKIKINITKKSTSINKKRQKINRRLINKTFAIQNQLCQNLKESQINSYADIYTAKSSGIKIQLRDKTIESKAEFINSELERVTPLYTKRFGMRNNSHFCIKKCLVISK